MRRNGEKERGKRRKRRKRREDTRKELVVIGSAEPISEVCE